MQRIAGTVAIMLYEMKIWPDGTFECLTFVGLEALIGPVPEGMTPDEAYDAAVHPDDREAYDATGEALARGESVEIEYRLLGHDGQTRWVLDRMRPEGTAEDGSLLVDGVVADITARKRIEAEAIEKLAHAALRDSLTGLANRTAFLEHLDAALARAESNGRRRSRPLHRPRQLQAGQRQLRAFGRRRTAQGGRIAVAHRDPTNGRCRTSGRR